MDFRLRSEKLFPVPDGFFAPLQLSETRLNDLRAEADKALKKALLECREYTAARGTYLANAPPWKLHVEYDGLSEYKRRHATKPTTSESRIFGTVRGNYRELVKFFKSETREAYLDMQKKLIPHTVDAAVLYTVPPRNSLSLLAYESVKWAAYKPFSLRFRMDSCQFESMGTGVDANGKPYAFRVLIPAAFPEVPDLFASMRTVRAASTSVLIALPSERNAESSTELFVSMQNDFKSNRVPRSMYKRYLMSLSRIHEALAEQSAIIENDWIAERESAGCGVCARKFSLFRGRHECHVCGEIVCRKCLLKGSDVFSAALAANREAASSKLCSLCIKVLREDYGNVLATPVLSGDKQPAMVDEHTITKTTSVTEDESLEHHARLSETPTEVGSLSENSGSQRNHLRSLVSPQPVFSNCKRGRFASEHAWHAVRVSDAMKRRSRSLSTADELASPVLASPVEIGLLYDSDVISEEDFELTSQSSVLFSLNTSQMARVPRPKPDVFETISTAIQEQEMLLRQMKQQAARAGRA